MLFVDDAPELRELVLRAFEGNDVRVAATVSAARNAIRDELPEVLILDVDLPDGDGVQLCRSLRQDGVMVPILMLTAHGQVHQRVAGLDAGADDFIAKPFAMSELRARIRALVRRGPLSARGRVRVGSAEIDPAARRAWRGDTEVPVTRREWAVIDQLLVREGVVVAREHLLDAIWGEDSERTRASLDTILSRIRRKLGAEAIETRRGQGHVLHTR
ncbi:MAG: response regulator transcription factor [Myxococcota bacterium]